MSSGQEDLGGQERERGGAAGGLVEGDAAPLAALLRLALGGGRGLGFGLGFGRGLGRGLALGAGGLGPALAGAGAGGPLACPSPQIARAKVERASTRSSAWIPRAIKWRPSPESCTRQRCCSTPCSTRGSSPWCSWLAAVPLQGGAPRVLAGGQLLLLCRVEVAIIAAHLPRRPSTTCLAIKIEQRADPRAAPPLAYRDGDRQPGAAGLLQVLDFQRRHGPEPAGLLRGRPGARPARLDAGLRPARRHLVLHLRVHEGRHRR